MTSRPPSIVVGRLCLFSALACPNRLRTRGELESPPLKIRGTQRNRCHFPEPGFPFAFRREYRVSRTRGGDTAQQQANHAIGLTRGVALRQSPPLPPRRIHVLHLPVEKVCAEEDPFQN